MRISITFSIPFGASIPVNYNHILTGLIYRLAGGEAPEWAARLHEQGFSGAGNRPYKFFTFSQLFGGPGSAKVESGRLIFTTDTLRWTFGSCLPILSTVVMDALLSSGTVNIGGMEAKMTSVKAERRSSFPGERPDSRAFLRWWQAFTTSGGDTGISLPTILFYGRSLRSTSPGNGMRSPGQMLRKRSGSILIPATSAGKGPAKR